ncbi:hypothetical protein HOC80_01825 [archaeon]|nr:hypothetical protein [archaeon]MBT4416820.1 hypothetical protein [archaeon]
MADPIQVMLIDGAFRRVTGYKGIGGHSFETLLADEEIPIDRLTQVDSSNLEVGAISVAYATQLAERGVEEAKFRGVSYFSLVMTPFSLSDRNTTTIRNDRAGLAYNYYRLKPEVD